MYFRLLHISHWYVCLLNTDVVRSAHTDSSLKSCFPQRVFSLDYLCQLSSHSGLKRGFRYLHKTLYAHLKYRCPNAEGIRHSLPVPLCLSTESVMNNVSVVEILSFVLGLHFSGCWISSLACPEGHSICGMKTFSSNRCFVAFKAEEIFE